MSHNDRVGRRILLGFTSKEMSSIKHKLNSTNPYSKALNGWIRYKLLEKIYFYDTALIVHQYH